MQVLIVEDEINIVSLVRNTLEAEGFECFVASDGESGLNLFREQNPDLVLLDLGLPKMNGLDVCTHIRQSKVEKDPYVVMLTARGEEIDRIIGYSTGADDYISKPFSPSELVVRIRALFRRQMRHQKVAKRVIETTNLVIDQKKREVLVQNSDGDVELASLTAIEFDIFFVMVEHPGRVWTRSELMDAAKGLDYVVGERAIDSYIKRIRKKIGPHDRERFIHTHVGVGYRFEDEAR